MGLSNNKTNGTFASVLSTGEISVKCEEGTPGSVRREYEDSKTKELKVKFEKIYTDLTGFITSVKFFEGEYGKQLQLTVNDGGEETVLSFPTSSNFCEDLMKKLPSVNFEKEVFIKPYSFTDKVSKKLRKGVTIMQDNEKVSSYFTSYANEKAETINGLPQPEKGKAYDNEDWKMYFMTVRKFLINFIIENISPAITEVAAKMVIPVAIEKVAEDFGGEVVEDVAPDPVKTTVAETASSAPFDDVKDDIKVDDVKF